MRMKTKYLEPSMEVISLASIQETMQAYSITGAKGTSFQSVIDLSEEDESTYFN